MKTYRVIFCLIIMVFYCSAISAQEPLPFSQLDPNPYDPAKDPDIDMFISGWKESTPRESYGALIERDIFTRLEGNDSLHPSRRGAVLDGINRLSYATLQKNKSTTPAVPKDEQVIFYVDYGVGTITGGGKTADLHEGVCVLVPAGIEFSMTNTGNDPLKMYEFAEPVYPGFVPGKEILVKDENTIPISTTKSHWSHILRVLFYHDKALSRLTGFCPVWFDPMTMGQPHSHGAGTEEIWFVVRGEVVLQLGKELRRLTPGMAYKVPPNGMTPHSNINVSDEQIKLFWLMTVPK